MPKTKTFALYLVKNDVKSFDDLFTETANDRLKRGDAIVKDSTDLGKTARAFIFDNIPQSPKWLADLNDVFTGLPNIKNKSSSAIVAFEHGSRIFLIPFAHGWQYIDNTKIEMDFGLRVVIAER
ncbi:MAG: hypothetical protein EOQ50_15945 [Mesorhizobium sp.]|nr:MAG: hypothetical protein EOQ50_15945 [Mesorhizobium sp.]